MTRFLVPIIETNYGSVRCKTLDEAQEIQANVTYPWIGQVHWHHSSITVGDVEDAEAPEEPEPEPQQPAVPAEILLVLISEILWPPQCPRQAWSADMAKQVANLLIAHRPELTPTESAAVIPLMEETCG